MQALGTGVLIDGDLLGRRRVAPVEQDQLGAAGLALAAAIEEQVAVAAGNEPVQLVGQLELGDVGQALLGGEIGGQGALAQPLDPACVHLRRLLAGDAPEQLHEALAGIAAAHAAREARALVEHRLNDFLAIGLGEEDTFCLAIFVGIEKRIGPVFFQSGDVVAELALRIEHDIPQEHIGFGIDHLAPGVIFSEAFDEPEREGADRGLQTRGGGALGDFLNGELVGHLVRGGVIEAGPLARIRLDHAEILGAGDAEGALLHLEDVGLEELAIGVIEDIGNLE